MGDLIPYVEVPSDPPGEPKRNVFLGMVILLVALFTGGGLLYLAHTAQRYRDNAARQAPVVPTVKRTGSTFIRFGPGDVGVSHRWSLFSGTNPTVTFSCQLSSALPHTRFVALQYRPLGTDEWQVVEVHPRRHGICRATLRDLYRDMPYECVFLAYCKDTVIHSNLITFDTKRPSPEP